jgi:hypothetical protein
MRNVIIIKMATFFAVISLKEAPTLLPSVILSNLDLLPE